MDQEVTGCGDRESDRLRRRLHGLGLGDAECESQQPDFQHLVSLS
jgi:hypothetical protein